MAGNLSSSPPEEGNRVDPPAGASSHLPCRNARPKIETLGDKSHKPLAQVGWLWQIIHMAQYASLVEQEPLVVHTRPVLNMDDDQFFRFCRINRDLQLERTAEGDIIIMAPEAGSS